MVISGALLGVRVPPWYVVFVVGGGGSELRSSWGERWVPQCVLNVSPRFPTFLPPVEFSQVHSPDAFFVLRMQGV